MNKYAFVLLETKQNSSLLTPLSHQIIVKTPWHAALVTAQSLWSWWRWCFHVFLNNPQVAICLICDTCRAVSFPFLNPILMVPFSCFHSLTSLLAIAYQHIPSCDHIKRWMIIILFIYIALSILHRHYLITPYSPLKRGKMCQISSSLFHMRKVRHQGLLWLTWAYIKGLL